MKEEVSKWHAFTFTASAKKKWRWRDQKNKTLVYDHTPMPTQWGHERGRRAWLGVVKSTHLRNNQNVIKFTVFEVMNLNCKSKFLIDWNAKKKSSQSSLEIKQSNYAMILLSILNHIGSGRELIFGLDSSRRSTWALVDVLLALDSFLTRRNPAKAQFQIHCWNVR